MAAKKEMPRIEMVVGADGSFAVSVNGGRTMNAKLDRDLGPTEWISFPKDERFREACEHAASWLVGQLPRIDGGPR